MLVFTHFCQFVHNIQLIIYLYTKIDHTNVKWHFLKLGITTWYSQVFITSHAVFRPIACEKKCFMDDNEENVSCLRLGLVYTYDTSISARNRQKSRSLLIISVSISAKSQQKALMNEHVTAPAYGALTNACVHPLPQSLRSFWPAREWLVPCVQ